MAGNIMRKTQTGKRLLAIIMAVTLALPMVACSGSSQDDSEIKYTGKKNATISSDSDWVNSSIDGAIDENLKVRAQDDFYSFVNKDWILEQDKPEEGQAIDSFQRSYELVKDRKISIISGEKDPEANELSDIEIDDEELAHNEEIVKLFANKASDWKSRDKEGAKPLQPYIDKIQKISNLDEMSAYLTDLSGDNLAANSFIGVGVEKNGLISTKEYTLFMEPLQSFSLGHQSTYQDILSLSTTPFKDMRDMAGIVLPILKELGYSKEEGKKLIDQTYKIESMLLDHMYKESETGSDAYLDKLKSTTYSVDELDQLAGDYPLKEFFTSCGYQDAEKVHFAEAGYLEALGRIYQESNLDLFKSYCIVSTVLATNKLLDRASFDRAKEAEEGKEKKEDEGKGDQKTFEAKDDWDLILSEFVSPYIAGPMDIVYLSKYVTANQKKELTDLVNQLVAYYNKLIDQETWLSREARKATKEKLEAITINILYPDKFDSYMDINIQESDSLVQMVQKINMANTQSDAELIGKKLDRNKWDLSTTPTTEINAQYAPYTNSINIFAGVIADGTMYHEGMSEEELLSGIGIAAGHEITHAFDQNGSQYDKYGNKKSWWSIDDMTAFQLRNANLIKYYNALQIYPGSNDVNGSLVAGEVVADMGAMKATLELAKSIKGFDYDAYFTYFAKAWQSKESFLRTTTYFNRDEHPNNFLRVNVTCMQFDEFVETYDIKKGDGMYMAPKKRIAVW